MNVPVTNPPGSPDRPPVPRKRFGGLAIAMSIVGATVVGGYAYAAASDYEPGQPERDELPASVRSSPGGYRSHHVWYSGFHGGK